MTVSIDARKYFIDLQNNLLQFLNALLLNKVIGLKLNLKLINPALRSPWTNKYSVEYYYSLYSSGRNRIFIK